MENTSVCYKTRDAIGKCWTSASVIGEVVAQSDVYCIPEKYSAIYPEYDFYRIAARRKSGAVDYIIVAIADKAIKENLKLGSIVRLSGEIKRFEVYQHEEKRWVMVLFADKKAEILERSDEAQDVNRVCIEGYLVKTTPARGTMTEKRLADMLICLQGEAQENGYIPNVVVPCLIWDKVMDDVKENYMVGDKVEIVGRFQSRTYKKAGRDGIDQEFETQEISVSRVSKVLPLDVDLEVSEEGDINV